MLTKLYRKLIPKSFRIFIYNKFLGKILTFFRNFIVISKSKFYFLFGWLLPKTDKNMAYAFMGRYGITSYPYQYMLEYKKKIIKVEFDTIENLPYVCHNNRKLFFPASYNSEKIIKDYRNLIIEQDERSSHRYVRQYSELNGKTLLDIGSAEGIFALDTIDILKKVYIFECDGLWLKPLKATFAPWIDKVTFIEKYVSDLTNESNISIDDFLKDNAIDNLFLKMDIEGVELSALNGATNTLRNAKNINLSICTYHRKGDPERISMFISSLGFNYEFSNGLMYWGKRLSKGVIRCYK